MFLAGFNRKNTKEDLFIKGNHGISPWDQHGKIPKDSRRLSTEAGLDPLTCGADRPLWVTHGCTLFSRSVVAREGDSYSLIESSVVHLSLVGLAGLCYYRKHIMLVFSLVISPELKNRRQSLPKLELEDLSSLLYAPII